MIGYIGASGRIVVRPDMLRTQAKQFRQASEQLRNIEKQIAHVKLLLQDMDSRLVGHLAGRLVRVERFATQCADQPLLMAIFMEKKASDFEQADQPVSDILEKIWEIIKRMPKPILPPPGFPHPPFPVPRPWEPLEPPEILPLPWPWEPLEPPEILPLPWKPRPIKPLWPEILPPTWLNAVPLQSTSISSAVTNALYGRVGD